MANGFTTPGSRRVRRFAVGIALAYALVGMLWILLSDAVVQSISTGPAWLEAAQRYKGLTYVLVSAVALGGLVAEGYRRLLQATDSQQASELRVQDMFERHPQPMWVVHRQHQRFLKVNEAAVRHYGYTEAEFLAMSLADIHPAEDQARLRALVADPLVDKADLGVVRHRTHSGQLLHVRVLVQPVTFGSELAVLAMVLDVTAAEAARRAMEVREAQLQQLHQSLGEVLWLASADGHEVLYVSPAVEQVYGVSCQRFLRHPELWLDLVHPDDRELAQASRQQLMAHGFSQCEYRLQRPDGRVRWVADRKKLIVDDQGLVQMIGGIAEDITASKEAEAALRAQSDELAQRNAELERFNRATVGRELEMIRLKGEVNRLSAALNLPPPYRVPDPVETPSALPSGADPHVGAA